MGNIKKRDLFPGAGFQKKILALDASRLEPLPYQAASEQIWAANVRYGSKADIEGRPVNVCALPPKADIGTQPRDGRFVPKADILRRSKIVPFMVHLVGAQPAALAKGH